MPDGTTYIERERTIRDWIAPDDVVEAERHEQICPKCGTADVTYRAGRGEPGLFLICRACDYDEELTESA